MHRYLLHNSVVQEIAEPLLSPSQVGFMNGWGVFSTVRVADGVLFAFARHYERMRRDAALLRVPFAFTPEELERSLLSLVEANRAFNATLRLAIVRNKGNLFENPAMTRETDLIAFTADLTRWGTGVKLGYMSNGRFSASPFAGTKITSWAENLTWYETAHERGLDEFILLNERGQVSECTSANVFAIYGSEVKTPPLSSGCLPGVTRAILLEEIKVPSMRIVEADLTPSELEDSDQVFISSTTRELLPVLAIDGAPLRQDPETLVVLQQAFRHVVGQYILTHTSPNREPLAV